MSDTFRKYRLDRYYIKNSIKKSPIYLKFLSEDFPFYYQTCLQKKKKKKIKKKKKGLTYNIGNKKIDNDKINLYYKQKIRKVVEDLKNFLRKST